MLVIQLLEGVRQTLKSGTPYQKWKLVFNFTEMILWIIGVNVMTDCTRNWRSSFAGIGAAMYFSICGYTVWFYWSENKMSAIQCFALLPIVVPVLNSCHLNNAHRSSAQFVIVGIICNN